MIPSVGEQYQVLDCKQDENSPASNQMLSDGGVNKTPKPRIIFFDDIHRLDDGATAFVRIIRCDWIGDDRKYTEMMAYETLSKGAKASARKEIQKAKREAGIR